MFECAIRELKEGNVLARPIAGRNGITILEQGTVLSNRYIKRLHELGISKVYLENEPVKGAAAPKLILKQPEFGSGNRPFILNEINKRLNAGKYSPNGLESQQDGRFKRRYKRILSDLLSHAQVVSLLEKLFEFDSYIFEHSANVSIMSAMIGDEMGYGEDKMQELILGSLLFEVGMTTMPVSLVQSDSTLSEKEKLKLQEHTTAGFDMLREINGVPFSSALIALSHHERYDGSGYPFGRQGPAIPEYARIVALADNYNALVSPRRYRPSYKADDAMELLFASGNYYFDADLVQIFLKRMKAFPIASVLTLSSGQTGIVKSYSSSIVHRPVVQIIKEAGGRDVSAPYELDLASNSTITVLHAVTRA